MKKISVWLTILLTLVTFGIYSLFWSARNRVYLVEHRVTSQKLPRWLWLLVVPLTVFLAFIVIVVYSIMAMTMAVSTNTAVYAMLVASIAAIFIALGVGVWWYWHFGRAMKAYTQGRINQWISILLYFSVGPFIIAFYQYYINRLERNETNKKYTPSVGLLTLTTLLFAMALLASIASCASMDMSVTEFRSSIDHSKVLLQNMNTAEKKYQICVADLEKRFPGDVSVEEEAEYRKLYNTCETLYNEFRAAYDQYLAQ